MDRIPSRLLDESGYSHFGAMQFVGGYLRSQSNVNSENNPKYNYL